MIYLSRIYIPYVSSNKFVCSVRVAPRGTERRCGRTVGRRRPQSRVVGAVGRAQFAAHKPTRRYSPYWRWAYCLCYGNKHTFPALRPRTAPRLLRIPRPPRTCALYYPSLFPSDSLRRRPWPVIEILSLFTEHGVTSVTRYT